jgi:hypothetical protein
VCSALVSIVCVCGVCVCVYIGKEKRRRKEIKKTASIKH